MILYVIEDDYWNLEENSFRHWEFIKESLHELRAKLKTQFNQNLFVMRGDVIDCLSKLHNQLGIHAIHSHEETGIDWTYKERHQSS